MIKTKINDVELFDVGMKYLSEKLKYTGYEIIQYQSQPLVPQFVVRKNNCDYFLYVKVKRHPFNIKRIFSDFELNGYSYSCKKRKIGFLIAGLVIENAVNSELALYKEDKLLIDFSGIINMGIKYE